MFIRPSQEKDTSLEAFRAEVRSFCEKALDPETRRKVQLGQHLEKHEHDAWLKQLGAKGWLAGKWPKQHGGLGWGPAERSIFDEETQLAGAPWLIPFGVTMVGPVIYTFGSAAQKERHLPAIRANALWWCQGYSEPGAGSDLAGLKTRAVRNGDHYVVNGQKIWTTLAHWADWMFCLVRTNPDAKKQEGISFLLIDMKTPGITVKPIISIDLGHHLNEVFFDDVRVPAENLIGEPGKGWTYAKFLLANERLGVAEVGKLKRYLAQLRMLMAHTHEGGRPLAESAAFQRRLAEHECSLVALQAVVADQLAAAQAHGAPSLIGAAGLKIKGSELQQAILQTMMDVLARRGFAYQTDALVAGWNGDVIGEEAAAGVMYEHLYRRAATIYGGSSEVQKSIIAKGALEL